MAKSKFYGKDIIGIDESNNGFQKKGIPMVIASYLIRDYKRAIPQNEAFERKVLAFKHRQQHEFERRAREFLRKNPDFLYTTYSVKQTKEFGLYGRAEAMATLIFELFSREKLSQKNTIVLAHKIDDPSSTRFVHENLERLLKDSGIPVKVLFRGNEQNIRAIRKADRVAYYLAGLRFLQKSKKWPYRRKKVSYDYLYDSLIK